MNSRRRTKQERQRIERVLAILAIVTILAAWVVGVQLNETDIEPYLQAAFPEADTFRPIDDTTYTYSAWQVQSAEVLIGYVAIGEAVGYGGPMELAVAVDLNGTVAGVEIIEDKETPSFLRRVLDSKLIESLFGKSYNDAFRLGDDVDGVTGATYTARAIAESVRNGSRAVAGDQLALIVPEEKAPSVVIGIPEIVLVALYVVGFFGHQRKFKYKKQVRWASMLVGLVVLGFIYNAPLTLANINQLLMGYWPQWQTHLYWFLMLGGIIFVFTVDNKNPYCEWFCPFGAAQECLGVIGGAKPRSPGRYRDSLKWLQRGLAWAAIVLALLFRNPGLTSFEIFGTLFNFTGSTLQFAALAIILLAALFIKRPWCNYLCPMHPVTDFYRAIRQWGIESWQNLRKKANA